MKYGHIYIYEDGGRPLCHGRVGFQILKNFTLDHHYSRILHLQISRKSDNPLQSYGQNDVLQYGVRLSPDFKNLNFCQSIFIAVTI